MSYYPESNPLDQPYEGAMFHLKQELSKILEDFSHQFKLQKETKQAMSEQLRLHQTILLSRSSEIGGKIDQEMHRFMQACADYANGHGKMEVFYQLLEKIKRDLKS